MFSFILREDDLDSGFTSFSRQLQSPIADNTLLLPEHMGTGLLKGLPLEEGLYLRYARVCYKEDVELIRLASQQESERIFSLCYLLTPGSLKLIRSSTNSVLTCSSPGNVFLTSNNMRLSVQIPEGVLSHTIELSFTREWLDRHLADMGERIKVIGDSLSTDEQSSLQTQKTLAADELLLGEIEQELYKPTLHLLTIRARVLLLLSNAFSRWPEKSVPPAPIRKTWHVQTIRQVEQRLVQSLEDMLPPQRQLAREFALSESTLKRHFKAVYGKTMYDYYLEKKMELAKWLLQEKKISVSETAYMLGYEKVSAFISMFKKYHHILPGSLK